MCEGEWVMGGDVRLLCAGNRIGDEGAKALAEMLQSKVPACSIMMPLSICKTNPGFKR